MTLILFLALSLLNVTAFQLQARFNTELKSQPTHLVFTCILQCFFILSLISSPSRACMKGAGHETMLYMSSWIIPYQILHSFLLAYL